MMGRRVAVVLGRHFVGSSLLCCVCFNRRWNGLVVVEGGRGSAGADYRVKTTSRRIRVVLRHLPALQITKVIGLVGILTGRHFIFY